METEEILERANQIVSPFGLNAEFLGEDAFSVGVGGDQRSYTRVINLMGPWPGHGHEILAKVSREITNTLPVNRVTVEITDL